MRRIVTLSVLTLTATTLVAPTAVSAEPAAPRLRTATVEVTEADPAGRAGALGGPGAPGAPRGAVPSDGNATADTADAPGPVSAPVETPIAFNGLWAEVPAGAAGVRVRTHGHATGWSDWAELEVVDADDGPDPASAEADAAEGARGPAVTVTEYLAVGDADEVQVELVGASADDGLDDVEVVLVDSDGLNETALERTARRLLPRAVPAEASSDLPGWIQPRSAWNAEPPRSSTSTASRGVELVVVHHTAGRNGYSQAEVPGIIRGVQHWHQVGNGWHDIGYNAVVDRFGQVWEGRAGGLDRAVIGAHASGFNTGSFGVSVLGDHTAQQASDAALEAMARVIGWKADLHGFDPTASVSFNGATRPVVVGHRDVGSTACPGLIQQRLPQLRERALALAGPFQDVVTGPHRDAIGRLARAGVVNGCALDRFCPRNPVTRGQAAAMLSRALDLPAGDGSRFTDVSPGHAHASAVGAVADRGILQGYADGGFRPEQPMSRAHMASALARAMELEPRDGDVFLDVDGRSVHGGNIYAIHAEGVTEGCQVPGHFCPDLSVTRDQMASFVDRMRQR